ncbi:MAG: transcriptional regulator [Phycisphaerales bacterium]|nr:transcriptional regulator [Phycisphaerales bacterium]
MNTTRTQRLIRLLQMLQSGRKYDADALAEDLRVSRRTLFRDLNMLEAAGVPYGYDKKTQRYSIGKDYFLPPVNLTVGEALALMLITRKLTNRQVHPEYRQAIEAAMKVEAAIPPRVRRHCGSIIDNVDVEYWPISDVEGVRSVLDTVHHAINLKRKLAVKYDSYFDGGIITTTLHPYRAAFIRRAWYVIGHSERHEETRMFKLERIEQINIMQETYPPKEDFRLDEYVGNAWQMIRGEQRYHIALRFAPMVAGNVEEVLWHKTQMTQRLPDGSLRFEVDIDGLSEIAWWILGYGDQVEVLEPTELREIIAEHARNMLAFHGTGGARCEQPQDVGGGSE